MRRPRQREWVRRSLRHYYVWGFDIDKHNNTKHKLNNPVVIVNDVDLTEHVNTIGFVQHFGQHDEPDALNLDPDFNGDNPDDPALD